MNIEKNSCRRLPALQLPKLGCDYLDRVRSSPPSRKVGSTGARNTTWRYASQKMGCTIQAESSLEHDFIVRCEYENQVLEFWDQPENVSVTFTGKAGTVQRVSYTPDFLVIERRRVIAYQVKPKKQCEVLVSQRPGRWAFLDGRFHDRSAEDAYKPLGIEHIVVTEDDISPILSNNLSLLLQARRQATLVEEEKASRILSFLAREGVSTIGDILRRTEETDATTVLKLVDADRVHALLDKHRLADLEDALIGLNHAELQNVAANWSELRARSTMEGVPLTEAPSLKQTKDISLRLSQLRVPIESIFSTKTLARWKKALRDAKGDVRSLIPKTHLRGNRLRRVGQIALELMHEAINSRLLIPNPGTTTAAYCTYVNAHKAFYAQQADESLPPPKPVSLPTFFKEVSRIPLWTKCLAQGGKRLANVNAAPIEPSARSLNPLRPFERAHIDHYLIDQHVVVLRLRGRRPTTKRPWLTVMIDQATKVVLAISISFRSPSRYACACVMRDCVRRHGRLPETIVVDHGSEFDSTYFEVLLARYGVSKHERPPGDPRFGGDIESAFHSIREELIRQLQGSTSNDERGRSVSGSHRGQAQACWRLPRVYLAYQNYFYQHFNLKVRGTNICSADGLFEEISAAFPVSGMAVSYDESFLIATAIPQDGKFTVTHTRGITHHDRWFFDTKLLLVPNGSKVDVLEDPWDCDRIYASINNEWVTCLTCSTQSPYGSSEQLMFRSISFLETQSMRAEEALARRVALEADETNRREATTNAPNPPNTEVHQVATSGTERPRLPSPSDVKPQPYTTHQGDFHEHSKHC